MKKRHENTTRLEISFHFIPFQGEKEGELLARFRYMSLSLKKSIEQALVQPAMSREWLQELYIVIGFPLLAFNLI